MSRVSRCVSSCHVSRDDASPALRLSDLPVEERPREKLLKYGASILSTTELLMVLIGSGTKRYPVQQVAERVLALYKEKTMASMVGTHSKELKSVHGLGDAKAALILAAIELGRRLLTQAASEKLEVQTPEDVANFVMPSLRFLKEERFFALLLDRKHRILSLQQVSVGSATRTVADPKVVFRLAVEFAATGVILVHNHPSGDPTPSREDIELTRRMVEAGDIMEVDVLDHIIIGDNRFISLKEKGHM